MSGKLYQKNILSLSLTKKYATVIGVLLLILTGVFIALLRAYLRVPLNIPGRHGIEVMGILMAARMISGQRFASSITMLASGSMMFLPFMGFKDPTIPAMYMIMGFSLDFLWNKFKLSTKNAYILALFGGLTYMMIPVLRLGIHFSGLYFISSFAKHGIFIPIISHFLFGALGTLVTFGIIKSIKK